MHVYISSLGCVRNQVDSEIMTGRITAAGHKLVREPEDADAIVINTCSFIESAADESIDTILELARYKSDGNCQRLIVAGCLPQRYGPDTAATMPEVDVFLGTGAYDRIVEALNGQVEPGAVLLPVPETLPLQACDTPRVTENGPMAYVKIMEGCNRHCTYCIIPKLRGRMRSRPRADIVAEVKGLVDSGFTELIVIGQDTTAYGQDLAPSETFSRLLGEVAEAAPDCWIRFLYGHPDRIDEALLQTVANHANICPYFDIPVQHASRKILKKMGRFYGKKELIALFERIRSAVPNAALRTTLMVGFPGETEAEFQELLDFIEAVAFDHLGVFIYSDSEDLPSQRLNNHVSPATAGKRLDSLMCRQAEISYQINQKRIGQVYPVLVGGQTDPPLYTGRTVFQAPEVDGVTFIDGQDLKTGQRINVRITEALEYDLKGEPA